MPSFSPPFTSLPAVGPDTRGVAHALFRHYDWATGQTVLKESGVYTVTQYPTSQRCAAAEAVYLGGHVYDVDEATAAELTAAGFGAQIV